MGETASIRMAMPADVGQLLEHCRMHNAETGVYGLSQQSFPFDDDEALATIGRGVMRDLMIIAVIGGEPGDQLEASVCLQISKVWWSKSWNLDELWTFVHPDFRRSRHAKDLQDYAKKCSKELTLPLVGGMIANKDTGQKLRLYQRAFGYPVGAYFVYDPENPERGVTDEQRKFWRNPFPEPGVEVVETKGKIMFDAAELPEQDARMLQRLKTRLRAAPTGAPANGQ